LIFFGGLVPRDRVQEDSFGVDDVSWVAIENETLVHARRAADSILYKLLQSFVVQPDLDGALVEVRVLLLSCLLILLDLLLLQLLDLVSQHFAHLIFRLGRFIDHLVDCQVGNAVTVSQKLGEVSLTRSRWATDKDFEREETSE